MAHTDWADERYQFEQRVARSAVGPPEHFSDRDGTTMLTVATLDAFEGDYGSTPYLMLTLGLSKAGRFLRSGDWGRVDGIFRSGTQALVLPNAEAEGFSPKARLMGLNINPERAHTVLADVGGIDALVPAAGSLGDDPLISSVMTALWHDAEAHGLCTAFLDHGLDLILRRFVEIDRPRSSASVRRVKPLSSKEIQKIAELIESRIGSDLTAAEIASELGRDMRSLTRSFRASTGYAPYEYLTFRRMERAKELLQTEETIMEIALQVGYSNPAKFAAAFRRFCGCSPSEWRCGVR
ncbi:MULTISPECIES: AraC family transcriptional regulator [Alphaproteobacteria]|uniref:AraC family transcriptional regulator n=1 Tax=Alphaproteobacteria TaxID=28211 RepID=UPI003266361B